MKLRHPLLDTATKRQAFVDEMFGPRRLMRDKVKLYDRDQKPLPVQLTLAQDGGNIEWDHSTDDIVWSGNFNILDPEHRLPISGVLPSDGRSWQSKYIKATREIWVPSVGWVDWDLCFLKIRDVGRDGDIFTIDAAGKESEHLGDRLFVRTLSIRKNTPIWKAVRHIFQTRGETRFNLTRPKRKMSKAKTFSRLAKQGKTPWLAAQQLIKQFEEVYQLFYGRDGRLTLRRLPEQPTWKLSMGQRSIVLDFAQSSSDKDYPQVVILKGKKVWRDLKWDKTSLASAAAVGATNVTVVDKKHAVAGKQIRIGPANRREKRDITSIATNTVHFTKRALTLAQPKGTPVWILHRVEFEQPAIGKAHLPPWHPRSAQAETNGDRPRVHFENLGDIRRKTNLHRRAQKIQDRAKAGVESTKTLTMLWLPFDPMDLLVAGGKRIRARSGAIQLSLDAPMVVNHSGLEAPTKKTLRQAKKMWNKTHRSKA